MDPEQEDESEDGVRQTDPEEEAEPNRQQCPRDWEAIMEGAEGLAYDDPPSDSNAMVMAVDSLQGPAFSLHDEAANPHASHPEACGPMYAGVTDGPYAAIGGSNCWQRHHRGACG